MKRCSLLCCLCLLGCLTDALASSLAPVMCKVRDIAVYQSERYSLRRGAILSNQYNTYKISLLRTKPGRETMPETRLGLESGQFGFSSLVNFFYLTVDGIEQKRIFSSAEDLSPWSEGRNAGAEIHLNYNGVKFILRLFMRPDSPVLWGLLRPSPETLERAGAVKLRISMIPSKLLKKDGKVVWNGGYHRMAVTPARTIHQTPRRVVLQPTDTEITFQDKVNDGSSPEKGEGPCWLQLDYQSIEKAELRINDDWCSSVYLTLNPDLKELKFAYWQQRPRISNEEFARKLQRERPAFIR